MILKPVRFTGGLFCWFSEKDEIWRCWIELHLGLFCLTKGKLNDFLSYFRMELNS